MRIALLASALGLLMVTALPGVASAATAGQSSSCASQGPIVSGLWSGFSMATGMPASCGTVSGTTPTAGSVGVPAGSYVALGDSVAAGLGLPSAGGDAACGVSSQAYPSLVAANLRRPVTNLACSGATAGDLFTEQHLSDTTRDIEPQLTRAFANGTPGLMTVTAGANDTYWPYFIRKCYVATCGTTSDQTITAGLLSALRVKLTYALTSIDYRSNGKPPRVILTGYYQPFSTACATQQTSVTMTELNWLNAQTQALNQTIMSVVSGYSFARFAPVSFTGHELCTNSPWIQGLGSAAPFHPTAAGQRVIARAVLAQVR